MADATIITIRHDVLIRGQYHRLAPRTGAMKAGVAIARKMFEWVWEMPDGGTGYGRKKRRVRQAKAPEY